MSPCHDVSLLLNEIDFPRKLTWISLLPIMEEDLFLNCQVTTTSSQLVRIENKKSYIVLICLVRSLSLFGLAVKRSKSVMERNLRNNLQQVFLW